MLPRRFFFALIGAFMFLSPFALHAQVIENNVPYLDAAGAAQTANNVTVLADATDIAAGGLTGGWHLVRGAFAVTSTILITGDVHLILEENSDLTVDAPAVAAINVSGANSLTVYAQSANAATMGSLTANGVGAGIGGNSNETGGIITINGGAVTANGDSGGAGIGGGFNGAGGIITINGGAVTASGGSNGAGIGGGSNGASGTITISGGAVTASGGFGGAGIGGGHNGAGGAITISGGAVNATGSRGGAGIGGGGSSAGGAITISGGAVIARGGDQVSWNGSGAGAGIGGGGGAGADPVPASGNITISGDADVVAVGGNYPQGGMECGGGAGIGTGGVGHPTAPQGVLGTITISTTGDFFAIGGTGVNGRHGAAIGHGGLGAGAGTETNPGGTTALYGVTVTQAVGGVITPPSLRLTGGWTSTFHITPHAGNLIASVTVDGTPDAAAAANGFHTFVNVAGNHTLTAAFLLSDANAVAADAAALTWNMIRGANIAQNNVTANLAALPLAGANGTTIAWSSSNAAAVSDTGAVTRPPFGSPNANVTLTATISRGAVSDTVVFNLTVIAAHGHHSSTASIPVMGPVGLGLLALMLGWMAARRRKGF